MTDSRHAHGVQTWGNKLSRLNFLSAAYQQTSFVHCTALAKPTRSVDFVPLGYVVEFSRRQKHVLVPTRRRVEWIARCRHTPTFAKKLEKGESTTPGDTFNAKLVWDSRRPDSIRAGEDSQLVLQATCRCAFTSYD